MNDPTIETIIYWISISIEQPPISIYKMPILDAIAQIPAQVGQAYPPAAPFTEKECSDQTGKVSGLFQILRTLDGNRLCRYSLLREVPPESAKSLQIYSTRRMPGST